MPGHSGGGPGQGGEGGMRSLPSHTSRNPFHFSGLCHRGGIPKSDIMSKQRRLTL